MKDTVTITEPNAFTHQLNSSTTPTLIKKRFSQFLIELVKHKKTSPGQQFHIAQMELSRSDNAPLSKLVDQFKEAMRQKNNHAYKRIDIDLPYQYPPIYRSKKTPSPEADALR